MALPEGYEKRWQAKAPDETVQLSRERLTQVTRNIVPELIDAAIEMKQTNQLAKQVKRMLAHSGQVFYDERSDPEDFDRLTAPLTGEGVFDLLGASVQEDSPYYNVITRYMIKKNRTTFVVKSQDVIWKLQRMFASNAAGTQMHHMPSIRARISPSFGVYL